jgi:hypothetical protein
MEQSGIRNKEHEWILKKEQSWIWILKQSWILNRELSRIYRTRNYQESGTRKYLRSDSGNRQGFGQANSQGTRYNKGSDSGNHEGSGAESFKDHDPERSYLNLGTIQYLLDSQGADPPLPLREGRQIEIN